MCSRSVLTFIFVYFVPHWSLLCVGYATVRLFFIDFESFKNWNLSVVAPKGPYPNDPNMGATPESTDFGTPTLKIDFLVIFTLFFLNFLFLWLPLHDFPYFSNLGTNPQFLPMSTYAQWARPKTSSVERFKWLKIHRTVLILGVDYEKSTILC